MKNYFSLLGLGLVSALVLTGCSADDNFIDSSQATQQSNAISVNAYAGKTRAMIENADGLKNYSLAVSAYKNSDYSNYFGSTSGSLFVYNSSTGLWEFKTSTEAKQWESGVNLDFLAIAPSTCTYAFPTVSYEFDNKLPATISAWTEGTDVMYATATDVNEYGTPSGAANLTFNHALAQIKEVNLKVNKANTKVAVTKIEFVKCTTDGSISFKLGEAATTTAGTNNLSKTITSTDVTYAETGGHKTGESGSETDDPIYKKIFDFNKEGFFIPVANDNLWYYDPTEQAGSHKKIGDLAYIALTLQVYTTTDDGANWTADDRTSTSLIVCIPIKYKSGYDKDGNTNSYSTDGLQAGHNYTINISMKNGFGYQKSTASPEGDPEEYLFDRNVKFNASVESWVDSDKIYIEL